MKHEMYRWDVTGRVVSVWMMSAMRYANRPMNVKEVAGREGNGKRGLELGTNERGSASVGGGIVSAGNEVGKMKGKRYRWLLSQMTVNKHQNWGQDWCLGRYRSYGHKNTNSANM